MSSGTSAAGDFRRAKSSVRPDPEHTARDAARFDALFAGVSQAMLCLDGAGVVRAANAPARSLLGQTTDGKILGRPLAELIDAESRAAIGGAIAKAAAGAPTEVECRHVAAGAEHTCLARLIPVPGCGSAPHDVLVVIDDTTEARRATEALDVSDARLRQVVDLVPHFIFAKDVEGRFVLVNRAVAAAYGTTVKGLLGKTDADFNSNAEEVRHFREDDLRVIESGRPKFIPEERITDASGKVRVLQTIKIPYTVSGSEIPAVLGVAVDITDRKRAEDERDRLFNSSIDLLSIAAFSGRFRQVNPAWTRLLGWTRDELLRFDWLDLVHPDDHRKTLEAGARLRRGRAVSTFENRYRCKNGTYKWLSWNAHSLPEAQLVLSVTRDITESKTADSDRQLLERQLQHAQKLRSLGLLAGGIAHDFNNLLFGIMGNADLAMIEDVSEPVRGALVDIVRSTRRAAELCKQMMAYAGRGRVDTRPVDVSLEAREMARLLESSISKKARVVYELSDALPAVEADPSQLRQVLMNLITNASDALGGNEGTICVETTCRRYEAGELTSPYAEEPLSPGPYVCLRVSDTGCGMTEHVLEHLFDPFFTTKFSGRGLGLSAVIGILGAHGGLIRVCTQPGEGTTMEALFPALDAPAPSGNERDVQVCPEWRGHGTVLLVDDEDLVREMGLRLLTRLGFQVMVAGDGCEAVELFEHHHEHIVAVLLDMTMPRMDGREAMRRLRAIDADTPVILMSGYEQPRESRRNGMSPTAFVQKPYRASALVETLKGVLGS